MSILHKTVHVNPTLKSILSSSTIERPHGKKVTFAVEPTSPSSAGFRPFSSQTKERVYVVQMPQAIPFRKPKPKIESNEEIIGKETARLNEVEEVKSLEKWEQKRKKHSLNFYVFNLTSKIQGKIMHEDKGPSINLKNINYINKVEAYEKNRHHKNIFSQPEPRTKTTVSMMDSEAIFEKDYFDKHVYMMKEKMVEMFKNSEQIPVEDKRTIEKEFHRELKELKFSLLEIKETKRRLFAENNEIHFQIEKINEEIMREEREHRRLYIQKRRTVNRNASNTELIKFVVEKEKAKREKEEKVKHKNDLKAEWERNKENIRVMQDKLDLVKSKIGFVKGILKEYYINLLKQGTDTRKGRGRGLIWIIQRLDKLGVKIDSSMFPHFLVPLQPILQNFLEEFAKKDKEVRKLKKQCSTSKSKFGGPHRTLQRKETLLSKYILGKVSLNNEYETYLSTIKKELRSTISSLSTNGRVSTASLISSPSSLYSGTSEYSRLQGSDTEAVKKSHELQVFKKEQARKLGKFFANISLTVRKSLLPRVTAALFGESAYEIEIIKHAQLYKANSTTT